MKWPKSTFPRLSPASLGTGSLFSFLYSLWQIVCLLVMRRQQHSSDAVRSGDERNSSRPLGLDESSPDELISLKKLERYELV